RLSRLAPGLVDDLLCLTLGELDNLRLGGLANRLLACLAENPVALPLRLGEHLLPLLDDPAGLLDLLRDRRPHLVQDVVDLLGVEIDVTRRVEQLDEPRSRARIASNLQLLDELQRILSRQRDAAAVAAFEEAFESLRLVHSPGFSGVPGRPSGNISANRLATAAGTSPSTFPPNEAISFTPLEETKLTSGLAIT